MGFLVDTLNRYKELQERIKDITGEKPAPQPEPEPEQPQPTNDGNTGGNNGAWVKTESTPNDVLDFMANNAVYNNIKINKAVK